jgi:hypothetical protein
MSRMGARRPVSGTHFRAETVSQGFGTPLESGVPGRTLRRPGVRPPPEGWAGPRPCWYVRSDDSVGNATQWPLERRKEPGAKPVAKLASQVGRVWLFELALRLEALAGAPMAAESAHGADEARSSGKRYFLRGQSLWGE